MYEMMFSFVEDGLVFCEFVECVLDMFCSVVELFCVNFDILLLLDIEIFGVVYQLLFNDIFI